MRRFDPDHLKSSVKQLVSADSYAWLTEKRWFADKGKHISSIEVADLTGVEMAGVSVLLSIIDVHYVNGGDTRYFVPLMPEGRLGGAGDPARGDGNWPVLVDAVSKPEFGRWLAELFSTNGSQLESDNWTANNAPNALALFSAEENLDGKPVGGEQSNSSVRIGHSVVVKVLRRFQPGVNPEDEVLRALSGFDRARVSAYLGSLYWHDGDGQRFTAAIAQTWVPNQGDGWTWVLEQLHRLRMGGGDDHVVLGALRDLGVCTAELHIALASSEDEAFGMQATTASDVSQVQAAFRASLERSLALLSEPLSEVPPDLKMKLPGVRGAMSELGALAVGFAEEAGFARIRVHGDYHLGQVLRTNDDWTIIDFEGEPARSVAERRQRSSPLRDVAGMLRSFSYARAVAEQDLLAGGMELSMAQAMLQDWERNARSAFVDGYRTTFASSAVMIGQPLFPQSDAPFNRALAAWEADKALYEVAYEARNRPGWLGIPLRALAPVLFDQV